MTDEKQICNAVLQEKRQLDADHGPVNMNPLELHKWITLMQQGVNDAKSAHTFVMDVAAKRFIIKTAALAMRCLEQHGLPESHKGNKEADDAGTSPADSEVAKKSNFRINEFYAEKIN